MKTKNPTGARIDALRTAQGLTLQELAARTGLTKGYLSKIMRASDPPPFSTLQKIASALNADITDLLPLVPPAGEPHNIDFLPAEARERASSTKGGICEFRPLLNRYRDKKMSPFFMRVRTGKSHVFNHDAEEFVYVLAGEVEMQYDGCTYRFKAGDCFYLDSRIEHTFINRSKRPADLLAVDFDYRKF